MVSVIYIVMLLAILSVASKLSLSNWWVSLGYGIIYMLFTLYCTDWAINSHQNEIQQYLSETKAHQIVAIIITIEFALLIAFAFRPTMEKYNIERATLKNKITYYIDRPIRYIEKYYVTLLLLPTLYVIEVESIYNFPGIDFNILSWIVGVGILLWCVLGSRFFRWILPYKAMREDFVLIVSLFMCLLALYSTNSQIMIYKMQTTSKVSSNSIFIGLGFFLLLFLIGFVIQRLKVYKNNYITSIIK